MTPHIQEDFFRPGNWLGHWRRFLGAPNSVLDCPVEGCQTPDGNHTKFEPDVKIDVIRQHMKDESEGSTVRALEHLIFRRMVRLRDCPHCKTAFNTFPELVIHENKEHNPHKSTSSISCFIAMLRSKPVDRGIWSDDHWRNSAHFEVGSRMAAILEGYAWYSDFFTFDDDEMSTMAFADWGRRRAYIYHRASSQKTRLENELTAWSPFPTEDFLWFMSSYDNAHLYNDGVRADVQLLRARYKDNEI